MIGVRENSQKVLLAIKSMGSESTEAWRTSSSMISSRAVCDGPSSSLSTVRRGSISDASVWNDVPVQRCTVPQA